MRIKINMKTGKKIYAFISVLILILVVMIWGFTSWKIVSVQWSKCYNSENFNCVDMSYAVGNFLKKIGIPVKIVYGTNWSTFKSHCWLLLFDSIEFESKTLHPNFFNKNCEYYKTIFTEDINAAELRRISYENN